LNSGFDIYEVKFNPMGNIIWENFKTEPEMVMTLHIQLIFIIPEMFLLQMKVKELIPTEILCRQYFDHRDDNGIFFIL